MVDEKTRRPSPSLMTLEIFTHARDLFFVAVARWWGTGMMVRDTNVTQSTGAYISVGVRARLIIGICDFAEAGLLFHYFIINR